MKKLLVLMLLLSMTAFTACSDADDVVAEEEGDVAAEEEVMEPEVPADDAEVPGDEV